MRTNIIVTLGFYCLVAQGLSGESDMSGNDAVTPLRVVDFEGKLTGLTLSVINVDIDTHRKKCHLTMSIENVSSRDILLKSGESRNDYYALMWSLSGEFLGRATSPLVGDLIIDDPAFPNLPFDTRVFRDEFSPGQKAFVVKLQYPALDKKITEMPVLVQVFRILHDNKPFILASGPVLISGIPEADIVPAIAESGR